MNKQKELWEKLAKENSKYYINTDKGRNISDDDFRQSGIDAYRKYILEDQILKSRDTILDYGCGNGRLTEFMADDFKKVIGVDISKNMIEEAKKRLSELKNINFLETDGVSIPLSEESVDIVFAYLVFQHIKEREMVINTFKEIHRILKPGGIFKVLMRSDKQMNMDRWWSGVEFEPSEIKAVCQEIGFEVKDLKPEGNFAYWLWIGKSKQESDQNSELEMRWAKGKMNTLRFYKSKLPWKAQQFNRELFLPDYFEPLIGTKKDVKIAEIGAGMFCTIGSLWKSAKTQVFPSDALAIEFNQLLKEGGVTPLIPVVYEDMENLSYPDNFFDIVHCANALDHTQNPLKAIKEMYRILKPGGYIYLRHFQNVGEKENYAGLHMWNLDIDKEKGFTIWNPNTKYYISDFFKNIKSTKKKELDYETEDMVVCIIQK